MNKKIRIGLPNVGRLSELTRSIFIDYLGLLPQSARDTRRYSMPSNDGVFEFIFVRSDDLPKLTEQGIVDLCITGKDYVLEMQTDLVELLDLGLADGTLKVLVPTDSDITEISDLQGKVIATQAPNLAKQWISQNNLSDITVRHNNGANEVYPYLGLADATVDIVTSGETARLNNLRELCDIVYSSGRFWANKQSYQQNRQLVDSLTDRLKKEYLKAASRP